MTIATFVDEWLPRLPAEEVRVFLLLVRLEEGARPRTMTYAEFGQRCGVAPALVHPALTSLSERGVIEYARRRITLVVGETTIKLAMQTETDDLTDLVDELAELRRQLANVGTESGLAEKLHAEQAKVIRVAETTLGRAVALQEAFYLGDLINGFGPERVIKAIQSSRTQKNPLRAAYAKLKRGTQGPEAAKKEAAIAAITYQEYTG